MTTLTAAHVEWLESRALDPELAVRMGLFSRGPKVAIPYALGGVTQFSKVRWPEKSKGMFCDPSKVPQTFFWNEDALSEDPNPDEPLVIAEGELDALSFLQAGFRFVVSVPSGADKTVNGNLSKANSYVTVDGQGEFVRPIIGKFDRVVIATDGDAAGVALRDVLTGLLTKRVCFLPRYPDGCKDANEVLRAHGVEGVRDLVNYAEAAEEDRFVGASDLAKRTRKPVPMEIGIEFLAKNIKITQPGLMLIAGDPGSGKSVIMRNILLNLMWTNPQLKASIFNGEGGIHSLVNDAWKFWNSKQPERKLDVTAKECWINEHVGIMEPPQGSRVTLDWLLSTMELHALRRDRRVFVIDPWNWLEMPVPRGSTKTDATNQALLDIHSLATRFNLFVIIVTHTTPKRESWKQVEPKMADIADSANFARRADHVLIAWRPDEDKPHTKLIIAKSKRHDVNGYPGKHWITFDAKTAQIAKLAFDPIKAREEAAKTAKAAKRKTTGAEHSSATDTHDETAEAGSFN